VLFLVLRAYLELIRFHVYLTGEDFASLYNFVRRYQVKKVNSRNSTERICAAVDVASIWYWKQVLCLQRSAATTCLLKANGITAVMIIGGQQMPFKAHAWVEVDGRVVNDKPYMREMYAVLDQC
jgi:transglutaminase superfamily protein